ncbi:hypothetical protein AX769_13220 [Frondihabitans sp. PAMC 28766]|nr:hypothetical protein AX769_13220 [Frondihabitans sp. PAMC 28766]
MAVAVLGRVLVTGHDDDASLIEPPGALAKALLVALTLAGSDGASSARLVDDVWGETPPGSPKPALQTLVSRVRQTGPRGLIESTTTGYRLSAAVLTDLNEAERLLRASRSEVSADPAIAQLTSSEALGLWRGEPGADLQTEGLAGELARAAHRLRADLLTVRAEAREAVGDHAAALDDLDSLAAGPAPSFAAAGGDEHTLELRLRALGGLGRRPEALRLFAAHREALADELGIDPSPRLVALHTELLRDDAETQATPPARDASAAKPRRTGRVSGLRRAPNELLGRDRDVDEVVASLQPGRAVTILGAGGLGKTRLAHEVGWRMHETRPELSVVVVELGAVRSAADVPAAIADPLGIRDAAVTRLPRGEVMPRADVRERIIGAIDEGPMLLVIDNCEHLVDAAAEWVADILASSADVTIVATSRSPLAIAAERLHPLEPLPVEGAGAQLFEERARQARPGAVLPRDVVERLCARLDGLPLAIELAAARVRSMPVDEIERRLGNRFALLTSGDRSAPERHRTLTAVIDWSWNLLGPSEQRLLRRLSPLPAGFSADAAAHVASCDLCDVKGGKRSAETLVDDDLDGLVAQSLVSVVDDRRTGAVRYRMLETVREFGLARLHEAGESALVRDALYGWALAFSHFALERLDGTDQVRVISAVAAEQDNLISVLRHAADEGRDDVVVVVFAALGYHWTLRGIHEEVAEFGKVAVRALLRSRPAREHRDAALLGLALAGSLTFFGDRRTGLVALGALRRLREGGPADDPFVEMTSRLFVAATTDLASLKALLDEGVRSSHTSVVELTSLVSAQVHENDGDVDEAMALSLRSHAIAVEGRHVWSEATAAGQVAELHMQRGCPAEALSWSARSRDGLDAVGAIADVHRAEWLSGLALVQLGRLDEARAIFERFSEADEPDAIADGEDLTMVSRAGLAEIALAEGRVADGVATYDASAEALRHGDLFSPWRELVGAAALAARVTSGMGAQDATGRLATRLRVRLVAGRRVRGMFHDVPILGSCAFALGLWLRAPGGPVDRPELGLRLLALGERLGARQDLGVLVQAPHFAAVPADELPALDRFRAEAAGLSPADALSLAIDLLADRTLRPALVPSAPLAPTAH